MTLYSQRLFLMWFMICVFLLQGLNGVSIASALDKPSILLRTKSIKLKESTQQIPCKQQSGKILIDFEGLGDVAQILDAYAVCGVVFSADALSIVDTDAYGSGNFANEPSPNTILFFTSNNSATLNIPMGMTQGFSFHYTAINYPGFIKVYSGENRTGDLLATLDLPITPSLGTGDPGGAYDNWSKIGVNFDGVAKSIDFGGTANQIGFDNITLGSAVAGDTNVTKFTFSQIADQTVNKPFDVEVKAIDQYDNVISSFNGVTTLLSSGGGHITPSLLYFSNGIATASTQLDLPANSIYLSVMSGNVSSFSNLFSVTSSTIPSNSGSIIGYVESPTSENTVVYIHKGLFTEQSRIVKGGSGPFEFDNVGGQYITVVAENSTNPSCESEEFYLPVGSTKTLLHDDQLKIPTGKYGPPVIVIPGIMGSTLKTSTYTVYPWLPKDAPAKQDDLKPLDPDLGSKSPVGASWMVDALKTAGYYVKVAPWDWRVPFDQAWQIYLKPMIDKAKKVTGYNKVDVVAHSMGGLVTRAYIQSDADASRNIYKSGYEYDIDKFIMLGTPNSGSENVYWMWDGGDPGTLDDIDGFFSKDSKVDFYTHATKNAFETQYDCWYTCNPASKIKSFYEQFVPTALQLMPTFDYLTKSGTTVKPTVNIDLLNLNSNINKSRMTIIAPDQSDPFYNNNLVKTKLFVSTSNKTILNIPVTEPGDGTLYPHGKPTGDVVRPDNTGDGTVPACQAVAPFFDNLNCADNPELDPTKLYINKFAITVSPGSYGSHAGLMGAAKDLVVQDLNLGRKMATAQHVKIQEATTTIPNSVTLSISGALQPYVLNASGKGSGINHSTNSFEQNIPNSKVTLLTGSAGVQLISPENGIYSVFLKGAVDENFSIALGYSDSEISITKTARALYHNGTIYEFSFKIDQTSTDKITLIEPVPRPGMITTQNNGGVTKLSWALSSDPSVSGYNIYSRLVSEPLYSHIGSVNANTSIFDTTHQWDDKVERMYVVVSTNSTGAESFYGESVQNHIYTIAKFEADKSMGPAPLTVKFTDTSLGTPTTWQWDFDGDGITDSTEQNPTYTFTENHIYVVKLTAAGPNGTDYTSKKISLFPQINGSCGSSNGGTFTAAPATDLCKDGTATPITGTGHPWSWACVGQYGGITANCSATIQTYTVSFGAVTGGTLTGSFNQLIDYDGSTSPVTALPDPAYHFVNWTGTGGFLTTTANPLTVTNVKTAQTITANFAIDTFKVNFVTAGNGTLTGNTSQTTNYNGSTTAVTAVPATGYHFVNWTGTDGFITTAANPLTVTNVKTTQTITANFAIDTFSVDFVTDGNGTLTGTTSQIVNYNAAATAVTAVPASGYNFINWTGTGGFTSASNPLTLMNVTSNRTITANFTLSANITTKDSVKPFAFKGGKGTINFTALSEVNIDLIKSAINSSPWITVDLIKLKFFNGKGSVPFTVAENPEPVSRSGVIMIGNDSYTINQSPHPCVITSAIITPLSPLAAAGGEQSVIVNVEPNTCQWSVASYKISRDSWFSAAGNFPDINKLLSGDQTLQGNVSINATSKNRNNTIVIITADGKSKKSIKLKQNK